MADQQFFERIDLTFRSREADPRARSSRFWNETFGSTLGRVSVSARSESVDSFLLADASLFVSDRKIVLYGSSEAWLDGARSLLERTGEYELGGLVYQLRGFPEPAAREMRRRLVVLREEIGDRLASAVVAEDTAFFHAGVRKSRLNQERTYLQINMQKLGLRVENLLHRPSYAQRQAGLSAFGIRDLFKGFQMTEHHSLDRYSLAGIRGRDYFTLSVSMREPYSSAMFEFCGANPARMGESAERILLAFGPKLHKISVLQSQPGPLPEFAGFHWQRQALGAEDSLAVLVEGTASQKSLASA